jgi:hypothetical protein
MLIRARNKLHPWILAEVAVEPVITRRAGLVRRGRFATIVAVIRLSPRKEDQRMRSLLAWTFY